MPLRTMIATTDDNLSDFAFDSSAFAENINNPAKRGIIPTISRKPKDSCFCSFPYVANLTCPTGSVISTCVSGQKLMDLRRDVPVEDRFPWNLLWAKIFDETPYAKGEHTMCVRCYSFYKHVFDTRESTEMLSIVQLKLRAAIMHLNANQPALLSFASFIFICNFICGDQTQSSPLDYDFIPEFISGIQRSLRSTWNTPHMRVELMNSCAKTLDAQQPILQLDAPFTIEQSPPVSGKTLSHIAHISSKRTRTKHRGNDDDSSEEDSDYSSSSSSSSDDDAEKTEKEVLEQSFTPPSTSAFHILQQNSITESQDEHSNQEELGAVESLAQLFRGSQNPIQEKQQQQSTPQVPVFQQQSTPLQQQLQSQNVVFQQQQHQFYQQIPFQQQHQFYQQIPYQQHPQMFAAGQFPFYQQIPQHFIAPIIQQQPPPSVINNNKNNNASNSKENKKSEKSVKKNVSKKSDDLKNHPCFGCNQSPNDIVKSGRKWWCWKLSKYEVDEDGNAQRLCNSCWTREYSIWKKEVNNYC